MRDEVLEFSFQTPDMLLVILLFFFILRERNQGFHAELLDVGKTGLRQCEQALYIEITFSVEDDLLYKVRDDRLEARIVLGVTFDQP